MAEVYYRKWRPRRLDQVVGQEPVTQTLRQAVSLGRVAHAYLFCGPRGTGKTSTARILAKAVNCLHPENGEPDNSCRLCLAVDQSRALDLIEIDAASNRGIDDIRNLSDKIHFTPNEGRYKVYIIDEVHMLTEPAFNALLKTLEEPPGHAILVLATTEAHKVPLTVISRCQRFDFRRISGDRTIGKLRELCGNEGIEVDDDALALIARNAGGSLRDAENLLEQSVVSYGSPVTEKQVRGLLGLGGDEMALDLADHVIRKEPTEGLRLIGQVAEQGSDLRQLHRGVMDYLRGALLIKTGADGSLGYPAETRARLASLVDAADQGHLVRSLRAFAAADMRRDASSPLPLELALVEVCSDPEEPVYEKPPRQPLPQRPIGSPALPPATPRRARRRVRRHRRLLVRGSRPGRSRVSGTTVDGRTRGRRLPSPRRAWSTSGAASSGSCGTQGRDSSSGPCFAAAGTVPFPTRRLPWRSRSLPTLRECRASSTTRRLVRGWRRSSRSLWTGRIRSR